MKKLMEALGITDIEELFEDIPKEVRRSDFSLPKGKGEMEVELEIKDILKKNASFFDMPSFIGGGIKPHYVPPAVQHILSRSEFYTSYTPYQAEASQGMLQALFEYQSIVCELTGMDVANISMYDAATSLGEAARMAKRITKKRDFIIPYNISWEKKSVLKNYVKYAGMKVKEVKYADDGRIDVSAFRNAIGNETAGIYIENPNFFGIIEKMEEINDLKENGLLIVGVDPLSLSLLKPPGDYGADIVIGDGWFGNPMNFGGPRLGVFSCRKEFMRKMPGKIIGATKDMDGKRAFCMTLQTREQHIRRGKATSNICSNEALCCIAFLAYTTILGKDGLKKLAIKNMENARYAQKKLASINFSFPFSNDFFNEFVAISPIDATHLNEHLLKKGIHGALLLEKQFPELKNALLYGITEMHTHEIIDRMIKAIKEIMEVENV
ncbi:MAG: aminomethyl-transferring glycine dehydrogenase subunit GcvPA [Thermoplasmata archaeon]|nr:MAG: aminomethyl-transferring glycine dehydrogenase subunit GcvPA [Thermoplasmata archaeon]